MKLQSDMFLNENPKFWHKKSFFTIVSYVGVEHCGIGGEVLNSVHEDDDVGQR